MENDEGNLKKKKEDHDDEESGNRKNRSKTRAEELYETTIHDDTNNARMIAQREGKVG
jgi:hypothetical protein